MEITHAFVTHTHPDHVGGQFSDMQIEGVTELLEKVKAKVVIHKAEANFLKQVSRSDLVMVEGGDEIDVGGVKVKIIHTPGHTPGSQCFLIENSLVSGDTLFIGSCGRADLPGGDAEELYFSLTQKLMILPPQTTLYPGHNYTGRPTSTLAEEKNSNPYLQFYSLNKFLAALGYE